MSHDSPNHSKPDLSIYKNIPPHLNISRLSSQTEKQSETKEEEKEESKVSQISLKPN